MSGTTAGAEVTLEGDIPSCQGCRRRKLRCSREQPVCSHCRRLGMRDQRIPLSFANCRLIVNEESPCVYDLEKKKPGIKPGAVGSLSRRVGKCRHVSYSHYYVPDPFLDALEEVIFRRQEQDHECCSHGHGTPSSASVVNILSTLAQELQKLNGVKPSGPLATTDVRDHAVVSPTASQSSSRYTAGGNEVGLRPDRPRKRRRVDSCGNPNVDLLLPLREDLVNITTSLPPADLLEETINIYFEVIQPWIPILHETQFRRRIHDPEELPKLVVVLHAMVVAALRYVESSESRLTADDVERTAKQSRNFVTLSAMDCLSVENLQALIILAFNDVGDSC